MTGDKIAVTDLHYSRHGFGAYCFDTTRCRVEYGHRTEIDSHVESPKWPDGDPPDLVPTTLAIDNFPSSAHIVWTAIDGSTHDVTLDVASIFSTQEILLPSDLDLADIPKDVALVEPGIILVVNGRRIEMYMRAYVPTERPQNPDDPLSDYRYDLVKAFSSDY
jgi:hypothetical protein